MSPPPGNSSIPQPRQWPIQGDALKKVNHCASQKHFLCLCGGYVMRLNRRCFFGLFQRCDDPLQVPIALHPSYLGGEVLALSCLQRRIAQPGGPGLNGATASFGHRAAGQARQIGQLLCQFFTDGRLGTAPSLSSGSGSSHLISSCHCLVPRWCSQGDGSGIGGRSSARSQYPFN